MFNMICLLFGVNSFLGYVHLRSESEQKNTRQFSRVKDNVILFRCQSINDICYDRIVLSGKQTIPLFFWQVIIKPCCRIGIFYGSCTMLRSFVVFIIAE